MSKIRLLVVDDSALIRRILCDMLSAEPDIEVVAVAEDGHQAIQMVAAMRPDIVTMDVEMPRMSGLLALQEIMRTHPTPVLMVSSVTSQGAAETLEALNHGAVDFVCKPANGSPIAIRRVREELIAKIRAARNAKVSTTPHRASRVSSLSHGSSDVVLVASSTGGPKALTCLFESLPKDFPVPIVVVQHMPATFTAGLAKRLSSIGNVPCEEATAGTAISPGHAYVAPGGKHLIFDHDGKFALTDEPPLHGVKPAADLTFITGAEHFGARCLAVVLTGMGRDGTAGCHAVKRVGGTVLVESEETCAIYGMPKSVVLAGIADAQIPIYGMAEAICEKLKRGQVRAA